MSEIVVEETAYEVVIDIEGGPTLTTTIEQELQTLIETPASPVVIDLNSGARGEPGSALITGLFYPGPEVGTVGDVFIILGEEEPEYLGAVLQKGNLGWVYQGNIRGPIGGINTVNGYTLPDVILTKADIGLGNADNTSDVNKPVSTATQTALDNLNTIKADDDEVVKLTGAQTIAGIKTFSASPVVPDGSWIIATTTGLQAALDLKAPKESPTFTGVITGNGSGLTTLNGSNISSGTVADARLSSNVVLLTGVQTLSGAKTFSALITASAGVTVTGTVTATLFSGSGASLTALNGTNISTGTVADARLSTNVVLLTGSQTVTGAKTFSGAVIVPTPTASNHAATKGYIDAIVDAAPGTLDTLNELAAALGDDPNFATTVTNSIASKVSLTGDETIAGIKTFSSVPVVADAAWTIAKTNGLQAALDLLAPKANPVFTGVITGDGSGLTALPATSLTGTIDDARLSSNVLILIGAQTITGVKTFSASPVVPDNSFAIAKVSGLSTSLSSKQDNLATSMMLDGANDWNAQVINAVYVINGLGANAPSGAPTQGTLHVLFAGGNSVTQNYYPHQPLAGIVAYTRTKYNVSDWQTWRPLTDATTSVFRVIHGATAGTARPAGMARVEWVGSVAPTNATADDTWVNTA